MRRAGSSPRVRGTPPAPCPASAPATVHPRGCGERLRPAARMRSSAGSSPRVRGTRAWQRSFLTSLRFIPAGAGNAARHHPTNQANPVHPRGCGEHAIKQPRCSAISGSSPRVRGTQRHRHAGLLQRRFIPAGAGNTWGCKGCGVHGPVHPRGCGEHGECGNAITVTSGSSPRVRGTHGLARHHAAENRFIPAGAGNTVRPASMPSTEAVHPRGCGEHDVVVVVWPNRVGSSPRVRGTRMGQGAERERPRFIPAGAGNTPRVPGLASP